MPKTKTVTKRQRRRWSKIFGFTVIEVLIIIALVAIIAVLVIMNFRGVSERSRQISGLQHANQITKEYYQNISGWWGFNECSGTSLDDKGDLDNDAAFSGTPLWSSDTPLRSGCSLYFSGSGASLSTNASLSERGYIKAAWIKVTTCDGSKNIMSQEGNNSTGSAFYVPGCKISGGHNGQWNQVSNDINLVDGKWHYVVLDYTPDLNNGTLRLYVDGKLIGEAVNIPPPNNVDGDIVIGAHNGSNYFQGFIDDPVVIAK